MDQYLIFTDAAVDLARHVFEEYDVRIIPMGYILNGKEILFDSSAPDRDALSDELFEAQKADADVHTSQVTPQNYIDYWEPELKAGHDILHISFSSGLSATYDNALIAAEEMRDAYPERKLIVVDSKAATSGQGVFLESALMKRAEGLSIEELTDWLNNHVKYLCHRFVVGDLNYLHKGGRVSKAVALIGTMLNIKPILTIDDEGKLPVVAKVRGRKVAWKNLIDVFVAKMDGAPSDAPKLIYITHSSQYEEAAQLKELVQKAVGEDYRIEVVTQTPIIGVHTGPDFFSVCGYGSFRGELDA